MRDYPFGTLQDIGKNISARKIVVFGAGNIAQKTLRILNSSSIHCIVDNASNLWGLKQFDLIVHNPKILESKKDDFYVLICTTSFSDVSKQLEDYGFVSQKDFIVSPILNDLRIISELESLQKKIVFSSGSPAQDSSNFGGGIYELCLDGVEWHYEKKISSNCYGIIPYNGNLISVSTEIGIFEFDSDFTIVRHKDLPLGTRAHGVAYCSKLEQFYVVGSYIDGIYVLNSSLDIIDTIYISHKHRTNGSPSHHCNDCCVVGTSLYVSMFSLTGNWKLDIFDGGVLEIDLQTHQVIGPVIQNLWMPHNICLINGGLTVLDSLRGILRKNNAQIAGQFPAFTRGLAYDGAYYYIGQSRNRNFSKNIGLSNNISIDTSIIIFDEQTKVSRSIQLPNKLSEIHSIILKNNSLFLSA